MSYTAGAVVRSTVVWVPESGSSSLVNTSASVQDAVGLAIFPTVVKPPATTETYYVDINIPDNAITGRWRVRWESSSPDMVFEDYFDVVASHLTSP